MSDTTHHSQAPEKATWFMADKAIAAMVCVIAIFCLLPHIAVFIASLTGDTETLRHLAGTVLDNYLSLIHI